MGKIYKTSKPTKDGRAYFFYDSYIDENGVRQRPFNGYYFTPDEAKIEQAKSLLKETKHIKSNIKFTKLIELYYSYYICIDKKTGKKLFKKRKESTLYTKKGRTNNHIIPFFEKYRVNQVKKKLIKKWMSEIDEKDIALKTKQSIFHTFSSYLNFAVDMELIEVNYCKAIDNFQKDAEEVTIEKKIKYQTFEEFKLFLSFVDQETEFKWYAYFAFTYFMGPRKGEQSALTWNDMFIQKSKVYFHETVTTKIFGGGKKITNTKNDRIGYPEMPSILLGVMLEYYNFCKEHYVNFNNNWFVFGNLEPLSFSTIDNKFKAVYKRMRDANQKAKYELSHHCFGRHSTASYLFSKGVPIRNIAEFLRDSEEVIRRTYAHMLPDEQKIVTKAFEELEL